jgi:AraC-like DNA-binding protein
MPESLNHIAERLVLRLEAYPTLVDLIGAAVAATRAGEPKSARARLTGSWGLAFRATGGIGFHIVLQGSAWLLPPDAGPAVLLTAGDVVLVARGRPHGLADSPRTPLVEITPGQQAYWTRDSDIPAGVTPTVMMGGSYYLRQVRPHPLIASLPPVIHFPAQAGVSSALQSVVDLLGAELNASQPGATAAIPALLDLLLIYGVRAWYAREDADTGWAAALRDPGITRALTAISAQLERRWTVEGLAREAGKSRAVFARRFAELIGQPPLSYLAWCRMTAAATQLRDTTRPIAAVAARVGYTSEFAFSRAFRREFGVAPGAYRRNHVREVADSPDQ